jgi:hypothetical protein
MCCSFGEHNIFRTLTDALLTFPSLLVTATDNDFCGLPYESYAVEINTYSVKHAKQSQYFCGEALTCVRGPFNISNALFASLEDLNIM